MARGNDFGPLAHLKGDTCKDLLQYQPDGPQWQPKQGFSETKFHSGFMRRQASSIPYIQERVSETQERGGVAASYASPCPQPAAPTRGRNGVDHLLHFSRFFTGDKTHEKQKIAKGVDMSVTVRLDPIFNVESDKTSPESWRNNPEKL